MRKLFFAVLCSFFTLLCFGKGIIDHSWQMVQVEQKNGLTIRFKIRNNPNLALKDWIRLEIDNQTGQRLFINHATYDINCEVFEKAGGKRIKTGKIASRSVAELFDHSLDTPLPAAELQTGKNIASKYPSTIGAFLLSIPDQEQVYVKAKINLSMQIRGAGHYILNWEAVPFDFHWHRPEEPELNQLHLLLDSLLAHPAYSMLQHYQLSSLLSIPEVAGPVDLSILLNALEKRSCKEDGRLAIVQYLNDHFPKSEKLLAYYFSLLKKNNSLAIQDLALADRIWEDRFLEPLIAQYEAGTAEQMVRVMDVLYLHQHRWIKNESIPTILSDLTLYKFEEIIYESPANLDRRRLLTAALVLDLLGKTGDSKVATIICPFLSEEERILDSGLLFDPLSLELPRPIRVCDNALEALLRLNQTDIINTYKKAKFRPPYEHGEGEIIITHIRDQLIVEIRNKRCK